MNQREAECDRLMKELMQLEQEARALDLRDRIGWEAHQRKIKMMREQIATFARPRQHHGL